MSETHAGRPLVHPDTRAEWRDWLTRHHATIDGAWVAQWTKASGHARLDYELIVEEALCFGWIDGLTHSLGDGRQAFLITPRRKGSAWSRSNKDRVGRLIAEGPHHRCRPGSHHPRQGRWFLVGAGRRRIAD